MKRILIFCAMLTGCAGFSRGCSSFNAGAFGSDWVVVQHRLDGSVFRCWKLTNASVVNEPQSDGVYWESADGHLVHITGWHNRIQVAEKNFEQAANIIGVDIKTCQTDF